MSVAGLLLLFATNARAATPSTLGDITVTEFQADTSEVPQYYGEWFELYNNIPGTLEIGGVTITRSSGDTITLGALNVASGDYLVLGVSQNTTFGDANFNGNVPVDVLYTFADFNISAPSDSLTVEYNGTMLDEVVWDSSWGVSLDYAHSASLNAYNIEWANDFSVNWCSSASFITVSGMYGSPGVENEYCGSSAGVDNDGDGYSEREGDCRDDDENIYPGSLDGTDGIPQTSGGGGNANDDADCDGVRDNGVIDNDADGYTEADGDCNDADAQVYPGARELADGLDNDCNDCVDDLDTDADGYGYSPTDTCGTDCASSESVEPDTESLVHPGATEVPYDGLDQDCDGLDLCDYDEDGYEDLLCGDCIEFVTCDCEDNNPLIHPGAVEDNDDGIDNDCDGDIDIPDRDGDGVTEEGGDCMDIAAPPELKDISQTVNPNQVEICGDLLDNDCDGFYDNLPECSNPSAFGTLRGGGICGVTTGGGAGALLLVLMGVAAVSRRRDGGSR